MFIGSEETTCYRDAVSTFTLLAIRSGENYVLTPRFSTFRNTLVRDNLAKYYNFTWEVVNVNTPFNTSDRINFLNMVEPKLKQPEIEINKELVA